MSSKYFSPQECRKKHEKKILAEFVVLWYIKQLGKTDWRLGFLKYLSIVLKTRDSSPEEDHRYTSLI